MNTKPLGKHIGKHGLAYSLLLSVLLIMALHYVALAKITSKTVQRLPKESPHGIIFPHQIPDFWNPWRVPDNRPGNYLYTITIDYKPYQQSRYYIYPTGCVDRIFLNEKPVTFDDRNRCNRDGGFPVNLAPQLVEGKNTLKIELSNQHFFRGSNGWAVATYGLQLGPMLISRNFNSLSSYLSALLIISTAASVTFFLRRFTSDIISGLIVSSGLLMYLRQVKMTSHLQYVIDMPSHFHYICYIANHGFPPKPMEGWEYYHPPFYYQIQAKIILWCNWLGSFDAVNTIRLFSVACLMVCIVFCTLILHRMIKNPLAYYPALIMMVFYPCGIFYAPRLDSHLLLYSFYAGCMYFLMRWLEDARMRYLWLTLVFFGFAIATRSNALVLVPLIGIAGLYQLISGRLKLKQLASFGMTVSVCVMALGALHNFGRTAHYQQVDRTNMPYIVGNINSIDQRHRIQNTVEHVLFLNTQMLFRLPYMNWWQDSSGRQYFWNSVLKHSLFDYFYWRDITLARTMIALMLAAVSYIFISLCWMRMSKRKEWNIMSIALLISLGMLMINRIVHPFAPSQNFRYIYPSLVCFCGVFGLVIEQHLTRKQYKSAIIGIVIILWFSYSSIGLIRAG